MTRELIFVYGTLRKDCAGGNYGLLASSSEFVSYGKIQGILYDLGDYPGLVLSNDGWVRGEVHALTDPADILGRLDNFEKPYLFERTSIDVLLETGSTCTGWVYFYAGGIEGANQIPSGDYCTFRR